MLFVRNTTLDDLEEIMRIYANARDYMAKSGNPDQWGRSFPPEDLVREDIENGVNRVICDREGICGVFAPTFGAEDSAYDVIIGGKWPNDEPYVTIHRIASSGRRSGIFACAFEYCKGISDNIRIDTHEKNLKMRGLIEKHGFRYCGKIYAWNGTMRLAYQWTAGK